MKVLIIKLGALGDIVIATPVIGRILEHHAAEETWLLTTPPFRTLFDSWQGLHVHALPRSGLINTFRQIKWVRQQKFDRIYDLQSNDRTAAICALSGCTSIAGNHPRRPYRFHPQEKFTGQCHSFERLNQIIAAAGLEPAAPQPRLKIDEDSKDKVNQWLLQQGLSSVPYVIMHAGSSPQHLHKRWPHFASLAQALEKRGYRTIWVGADDDAALNSELAQSTGIDATGQFSIPGLVELGRHAAFAVTNDSAPMHILACSDIPVFGLFGPTNPGRTHAVGQAGRVIFAGGELPENDDSFQPDDIGRISLGDVLERLQAEGL